MKLESRRIVTQPSLLGLPSRSLANLQTFPLLRKKEARTGSSHWTGAERRCLGGAERCYLCGVVYFFLLWLTGLGSLEGGHTS